jgi:hypothetical protein
VFSDADAIKRPPGSTPNLALAVGAFHKALSARGTAIAQPFRDFLMIAAKVVTGSSSTAMNVQHGLCFQQMW